MRRKKADEKVAASMPPAHPEWSQLLIDAVSKPGVISAAYSRFWHYSTGNQLLALWQCMLRGLELGPIHTFQGWKNLGRSVTKGQKAITLCMPVTVKRKGELSDADPKSGKVGEIAEKQTTDPGTPAAEGTAKRTVFTYKPHWFVLSQTDGDDYQPAELPEWSEERAITALLVTRVTFKHPNGNCQGYASGREVAVSPIAVLPHKTLFHELAHVMLGHTAELTGPLDDHEFTPRNLREVEAECVALICCESLNLPGIENCRGYVQHWLGNEKIPERSAQKIFKAADQILRAGRDDPPACGNDAPAPHIAFAPKSVTPSQGKPFTQKGSQS